MITRYNHQPHWSCEDLPCRSNFSHIISHVLIEVVYIMEFIRHKRIVRGGNAHWYVAYNGWAGLVFPHSSCPHEKRASVFRENMSESTSATASQCDTAVHAASHSSSQLPVKSWTYSSHQYPVKHWAYNNNSNAVASGQSSHQPSIKR